MTSEKDLKRLIRSRAAAKGESYRVARAHVLATFGKSQPVYPWEPEDGYTDNFWLLRAERDGQATADCIVAQPAHTLFAFVVQRGVGPAPAVRVSRLNFDRGGEVTNEVELHFSGAEAVTLKKAVGRIIINATAPRVVLNESLPSFPEAIFDARSLDEVEPLVGPEFVFLRPARSPHALVLGRGRTLPAPNPSVGIGIFSEADGGRLRWSDTHLAGFPAGVFRAAVNTFVGDTEPAQQVRRQRLAK